MKCFLLFLSTMVSMCAHASLVRINDKDLPIYKKAIIEALNNQPQSCITALPKEYEGHKQDATIVITELEQFKNGFVDTVGKQPLFKFVHGIEIPESNITNFITYDISTLDDKKTIKSIQRIYSVQTVTNIGTLNKPVFATSWVTQSLINCSQAK